ncbi:MAG: hypothetical protein SGI88_15985 [Candidatus Hydrogenedentes bacterium]|nr:hypothetical protein [Candidatus Hydrogenedentota bacterium]
MSYSTNFDPLPESKVRSRFAWGEVPWQIWVVSVLLALEGFGNLVAILAMPIAALWFSMKCLFIAGFFLRWRPVYVLFLVAGMLHVLAFSMASPGVALLNLAMVILIASTKSYFFGDR